MLPLGEKYQGTKPLPGGFFLKTAKPTISKMQRVIVYVDGFNFYYGLKAKGWKKFYWLDIVGFFERILGGGKEVIEVHYFSARPQNDLTAYDNQDVLFSANKLNPKFKLTLGKYLKKQFRCSNCGKTVNSYEEKETDVRIATQIINDVYEKRCDMSVVVSADSDMVPAVELVRSINPKHHVCVCFPPERYSGDLFSLADTVVYLVQYKAGFNQSMLPEDIQHPNGIILRRPVNWK